MKKQHFAWMFFLTVLFPVILSGCFYEPDPGVAVSKGLKKSFAQKRGSVAIVVEAGGLPSLPNSSVEVDEGAEILQVQTNTGLFRFEITGKSNSEVPEKSKFDGQAKITLGDDALTFDGVIDLKVVDGEVFMKLKEINLPDESAVPPDALNVFVGKWWVLPSDGEGALFKNFYEEQKKFEEEFQGIEFFQNPVKVGEEEVQGMMSRKYKVELNAAGVEKLVILLSQISENEVPAEERKALSERLKNLEFEGYVWVSKKGGIANRIAGNIKLNPLDPTDIGTGTFSFDFTVWDFGKKIEVEKPTDATPFNPAFLFGLAGLGVQEETIDQPLGAEQSE